MDISIFNTETEQSLTRAASLLSKSRIIPTNLAGDAASIYSILLMANELKIGPMQALNSISVISGRPTLSAQLMLALVRRDFPNAFIKIELDEKNLVAKCEVARSRELKDESYLATWDMSKAQMMGLVSRDQYKKQPMNMLKWRAVSEALRFVFPDATSGLYAKEELIDFDGAPIKELVEIEDEDTRDKRTPEQREIGNPRFLICFGKYRYKELNQIEVEELADYVETLEDRLAKKGALKDWETELLTSARLYLTSLEKHESNS